MKKTCNDIARLKSQKQRLTPTIPERLAERDGDLPVWVRAPVRGPERYSGLSRAKLYQLATDGKIVSKSVREPGKVRGCRLFLLRSILDYIESCPTGELGEKVEGEVAA
jgi:hypothetical protein